MNDFQNERPSVRQPVSRTMPHYAHGTETVTEDPKSPNVYVVNKEKHSVRNALIAVGIVVVLVAGIVAGMFILGSSNIFDSTAQEGQAPYKTAEEIQAELDRMVDEGMFNISIASVIEFEDGTSPGIAYIENVPGNRYNMRVVITDDGTGSKLYESGVLKPNQYIENITLDQDLEPGTYEATATFQALNPDTNQKEGEAAAKITLNVLN